MTKILFTASRISHITQFHIPYLKYYQEKGYEIHIAAQGNAVFDFSVIQHELLFEKKSILKNIQSIGAMRRIIKKEHIDIIISNATLSGIITRAAALFLWKKPVIIHSCHGYLFSKTTSPLKKNILLFCEKFFAPITDLTVTMNQEDYSLALAHKLGKKVLNIPGVGFNPPATKVFTDKTVLRSNFHVAKDVILFVYAAEFSNRKNQMQLIQSITPIMREHADWCLMLAGNGSMLRQCRQLVEDSGMSRQILLPGFITDIQALLETADIVVSFSKSEGMPFNIMEAMARGIPVIASRVKGHTDLIEDGITGFLFSLSSDEEFKEKIIELAFNDIRRKQFADSGSNAVKQFMLPNVFNAVIQAYAQADNRLK